METTKQPHFLIRLRDILIQMEETKSLVSIFTTSMDGLIVFDIDKLVTGLHFSSREEVVKNLQKYFCWSSLPGNVVQCSSAIGGGGYYWKLNGFSKTSTDEFLENVQERQTIEEQPRRKRKSSPTAVVTKKEPMDTKKRKASKTKSDNNVLILSVPDAKKDRFLRYVSVASDLETLMRTNALKTRSNIILFELQREEIHQKAVLETLLLKAVLYFSSEINRIRQVLKTFSSARAELEQYRERFITNYEGSFLDYSISQMKKYRDTFEKYLSSSEMRMMTAVSLNGSESKASMEEVIKQNLIHFIPFLPTLEEKAHSVYKQVTLEKEKTNLHEKIANLNSRFIKPDLPHLEYDETFLQHLHVGFCTCCEDSTCKKYSSTFLDYYQKSLLCKSMYETGHCISEKCCIWLLHNYQEHSFSCFSEICGIPGCTARKRIHQKKCFNIALCKYKCCSYQAKRKIESIFLEEEDEGEEEGEEEKEEEEESS